MAERSGESAPRRVGDAREEREAERHRREAELGTSWISVILGWLAALGASLILSGIVTAIVGGIFAALGAQDGATSGSVGALIGLLLTLLIAFFIGGYVAGRMASRSGLKHGFLVPLLALIVTILLALVGAVLGVSFIDQLSGVRSSPMRAPTLPGPLGSVARGIPQQGLGTILSVSGLLALLFTFIGGALGGARGAATGRRRPYA
jgi:MFS family permease